MNYFYKLINDYANYLDYYTDYSEEEKEYLLGWYICDLEEESYYNWEFEF